VKPAGSRMVATATAWAALGLGLVLAAFSLPIDDFWLSLASAHAIAGGADPGHAINLTWVTTLPGALNPQWGAQLILGALGTTRWALVANSALIAVGLVVTAMRTRRRAGAAATAIALLLMMGALAPHLLGRAQSFSIALLPLALLLLERRPAGRWLPLAYGLLLAIWANLHGAFVIGQLAALAAFAGELFRRRSGGRPAHVGVIGLTLVAALFAPLANPAGVALLAYAYAQPGLDVVRGISVEWQPAWPWIPVAAIFWGYLLLLVVARVARRGGLEFGEGLLVIGLGLFAAYSIRQIPWFLLATAPVLAEDLDALFRTRPRVGSAVGQVAGPLGDHRAATLLAIAVLAVVVLQPIRPALPESIGRVTSNEPVEIANRLARVLPAGAGNPILNEQVWGGYLSYRLAGRVQTAMDGRLEIRDRATWAWYFGLMHGDGDPAAELLARGVNWAALSPERQSLMSKLRAAGWQIDLERPDGVLLHLAEASTS
jgi:hypothetical protein